MIFPPSAFLELQGNLRKAFGGTGHKAALVHFSLSPEPPPCPQSQFRLIGKALHAQYGTITLRQLLMELALDYRYALYM